MAESELGVHLVTPGGLEPLGERLQHGGRQLDRPVGVGVEQRQHRLGETGEIPGDDRRLVAVGVPATVVDRTEDRCRVVGVHECTRPVVDGLAGDRRVVGVHHAVDEPDRHPLGDEGGLTGHHEVVQRQRRELGLCGLGDVASDRIAGERAQQVDVARGRGVLEGADTQVARRHPGEHRTRHVGVSAVHLPDDRLAGGDHREGPRRRDPQCMHRLAHQVLAQHRPHGGPAVPAPGERGAARSLEVQVVSAPPVARISPSSSARPSPSLGEYPPN